MRKLVPIGIASILAIALMLSIVSPAVASIPTLQKYEYYDTGDDEAVELYGNIWGAQTFTTGITAHTIEAIRLKLYREGTPGTTTVSIRETSGSDPFGDDLTSGILDGDNFTTTTTGVWYSFDLTSYSLEASTMYAIVVRAVAGDSTNSVHWRSDASAGAEPDGQEETSDNGGTTWTGDSDDDFMFEIWGKAVISVIQAQVFRGYIEENDMLFVLEYENTCPPYYPTGDPTRYFNIQLRSNDGATVLHQTICRAWDRKPGAIYLSADTAAPLTPGTLFRLYLYGDFTGNPSDYYTLTAGDWKGEDLSFLDSWCILTAKGMEEHYDRAFTTTVGAKGEVLNEEGGIIFIVGIPALAEVRPDLFEIIMWYPEYEVEEPTDAFQEAANWEDMVGTYITSTFTDIGGSVNLSGKNFGAVMILIGYSAVAIFMMGKGHTTAGLALAIPFLLLGAWLRLIDIVIIGVAASVIAILIVRQMWWSST